MAALRALEKTFGRVHALWKPVATEEAFEIVRRRLFEPVRDPAARERLVARLDLAETTPEWALGYTWDIVLRRTPFEE